MSSCRLSGGELKQLATNEDYSELTSTADRVVSSYSPINSSLNTTTTEMPDTSAFTQTNVQFYYIIMALILCIPAAAFFMLYIKRDRNKRYKKEDDSESESLALADCTIPLTAAISFMFLQCLLYFGIQDTYSNLLTTFAVLGPLQFTKAKGVYLTSLFWASMCFGRLNGTFPLSLTGQFTFISKVEQ